MSLCSRQALTRAPATKQTHGSAIHQRPVVVRAAEREHPDVECSSSNVGAAPPARQSRRTLLGIAAGAAAALAARAPPARAEPYLLSTGAKGILAEEEAKLLQLRRDLEGEVRRELEAERVLLENEARNSSVGKLCATPFGIDIVGITEFVALAGALVGGITARQRKNELERLNEQLRKVNMGLRQQARAGMVYAPGLTYVPPAAPAGGANGASGAPAPPAAAAAAAVAPTPLAPAKPAAAVATVTAPPMPAAAGAAAAAAVAAAAALAQAPDRTLLSMEDDELSTDQMQCRDSLRQGKRLLKEKNGAAAMVRFEKALMLSKSLQDKVQERRAMRGLAAAARLQGQYRAAIKHLERVLDISREMREFTGDADAYGTIADCYTELGDFELAAVNYDKYIKVMNTDGPV